MDNFKKAFLGKRVLVTGGTGSIGSEIVRQLLKYNPKQVRIYSRDESKQFYLQQEFKTDLIDSGVIRFLIGDIRDKERLDRAFNDIDIVFHAAALKHVPFCEDNPFEATKTNVLGTQNVIDLSINHKVEKVIAISSDKAVYPTTFMGITKLMMERLVITAPNYSGNTKLKFSVVRFGNVINSRGSVIPLWINQIKKGGPVTVTDKKMERYFMTIAEAVHLVFAAATLMIGSEIFVLKMPKYNIFKLANEVINRFGNGKKIPIKIIGARKREKIDEDLYTVDEKELMLDAGPFQVIQPNKETYTKRTGKYGLIKTNGLDLDVTASDIVKRLPLLDNYIN